MNKKHFYTSVIVLFLILCVVIAGYSLNRGNLRIDSSRVLAQTPGDEWPQLQHDFQRSGRAPHAVIPPFSVKWKWFNGNKWHGEAYATLDAEIPLLAQPVLGDGKVYLGSYNGKLYAINEQTGETVWSYQTNLSIVHTAGYAQQKVYVGSLDGYLYAVNTSDGSLAWRYYTGPIYSAPLILDNKVCIGSKTEYYYCFNLEDQNSDGVGDVIFEYDAQSSIYHTAAASPDGTKIYFGTENMYAHCVMASDGSKCSGWSSMRFPGQSFIHYWPVAVSDKVIFTTLPIYTTGEHNHGLFGHVESLFDNTSLTAWTDIEPMLIDHYTNNPYHQTFFVLNGTAGTKAYETAVSHIARHMDARFPPALGPNDEVYVMYRSKDSSYDPPGPSSGSFGTKYGLEIGGMDISTGHLSPYGEMSEFNGYIANCLDDPSIFSSGGGVIYGVHNSRCAATLDTVEKSEFTVGRIRETPTSASCYGNVPYFYSDTDTVPDIRGNNNRGEGDMSASIVGNSMYIVLKGGAVLAVTGQIRQ